MQKEDKIDVLTGLAIIAIICSVFSIAIVVKLVGNFEGKRMVAISSKCSNSSFEAGKELIEAQIFGDKLNMTTISFQGKECNVIIPEEMLYFLKDDKGELHIFIK